MRERGLISSNFTKYSHAGTVVPHAGTWIEITVTEKNDGMDKSFPTRERGLKFETLRHLRSFSVVPHAGTWIEIDMRL